MPSQTSAFVCLHGHFCSHGLANERPRFPPPWAVENNGAAFIVKEDEPGRRVAVDLHAQFNVQCRRESNRDRSPRRQTHIPVSPLMLAGVFLWPTAGP